MKKTNRFGSFFVHLVETIRLVVNEVSVIASERACTDERAPLVTGISSSTKCCGRYATESCCLDKPNLGIKKHPKLMFQVFLVETIRLVLNEVSVIASERACTDERAPLVTKRSWHTECAGGVATSSCLIYAVQ